MVGLLGRKLGMTQVYNDKDELIPVTVVEAGPCPIVDIKTVERDGYAALQLAFDPLGAGKVNKPLAGHFARARLGAHRLLREFRLREEGAYELGQVLDLGQFEVGDTVKVRGKSKGKGFAGVVKRHNFHGKSATHGTPDRVRHGGSIGQGTTPGKVWKGKKMPGHLGGVTTSVKGLAVVRVDAERNLLFLKGAVPGGINAYIAIKKN